MSLLSHLAVRIEPFRVRARDEDRRRSPRYEALGPGELRSTSGETLGSIRLVDESDIGLGCVSPASVEVGQIVDVRVGAGGPWRPAVVVTSIPCGGLRRLGVMFPARSERLAA